MNTLDKHRATQRREGTIPTLIIHKECPLLQSPESSTTDPNCENLVKVLTVLIPRTDTPKNRMPTTNQTQAPRSREVGQNCTKRRPRIGLVSVVVVAPFRSSRRRISFSPQVVVQSVQSRQVQLTRSVPVHVHVQVHAQFFLRLAPPSSPTTFFPDLISIYLRRPLGYSHQHTENLSFDSQTVQSNYSLTFLARAHFGGYNFFCCCT